LKKEYLISVILTVYNREKLVFKAIKSVLNQSYKNFEIIIIDDGSTDNSSKNIISFIKNFRNITFCRQKNTGNPGALNTGIKLSNGEFITFIDSDDEYEKDHLKKRINYFKKNPSIDLIFTSARIIGKEKDYYVPDARNNKKLIHLDDCVIGATLFGRKKVFRDLNGFKNKYSHDYDFVKRAEKKYKLIKLDLPTYIYYRNQKNSVINSLKSKLSG
jgi:glycosyltransferase involved in cell wall biosynthesis